MRTSWYHWCGHGPRKNLTKLELEQCQFVNDLYVYLSIPGYTKGRLVTTNLLLHFFSLSIFCVSFFFSKIITNFQSFFSLSKYVDSSITPKDRQQCSLCVNHYYSFQNLACQRRVSAIVMRLVSGSI